MTFTSTGPIHCETEAFWFPPLGGPLSRCARGAAAATARARTRAGASRSGIRVIGTSSGTAAPGPGRAPDVPLVVRSIFEIRWSRRRVSGAARNARDPPPRRLAWPFPSGNLLLGREAQGRGLGRRRRGHRRPPRAGRAPRRRPPSRPAGRRASRTRTPYLVVDLGSPRPVGALLLQADAGDTYMVEASVDGRSWTGILRVEPGDAAYGMRTRRAELPKPREAQVPPRPRRGGRRGVRRRRARRVHAAPRQLAGARRPRRPRRESLSKDDLLVAPEGAHRARRRAPPRLGRRPPPQGHARALRAGCATGRSPRSASSPPPRSSTSGSSTSGRSSTSGTRTTTSSGRSTSPSSATRASTRRRSPPSAPRGSSRPAPPSPCGTSRRTPSGPRTPTRRSRRGSPGSAPRWEAFVTDVLWFRTRTTPEEFRRILLDHGYNATPAWGILGGALARAAGPATDRSVGLLALLDPLLLLGAWLLLWQGLRLAGRLRRPRLLGNELPRPLLLERRLLPPDGLARGGDGRRRAPEARPAAPRGRGPRLLDAPPPLSRRASSSASALAAAWRLARERRLAAVREELLVAQGALLDGPRRRPALAPVGRRLHVGAVGRVERVRRRTAESTSRRP